MHKTATAIACALLVAEPPIHAQVPRNMNPPQRTVDIACETDPNFETDLNTVVHAVRLDYEARVAIHGSGAVSVTSWLGADSLPASFTAVTR
jgi:hypothetical protein